MKQFIAITFLSITLGAFAQNEVSTLYFGKTLLDFRYEPPLVLSTQAMDPRECAASICDSQGNLLFYSNGGATPTGSVPGGVFGPDNNYLPNGHFVDSGGCVSSFQGAIALPDPAGITNSDRKYYLFTKDCVESSFSTIQYNSGLTYAIIDMNENGGQGAVVSKYNPVVPYHVIQSHKTNYEPVTAVLDGEGEQKSGDSGYWLFSYTDDSLYHIHFGVNGFDHFQKLVGGEGALVVAPDRKHLVVGNILYHLDPVLGTVEYQATLADDADVAFSSDGTKMYVIAAQSLKQYDVTQSYIWTSVQTIAFVPGNSTLFLAPSKRILLYQFNKNFIDGEIVCTNNSGIACGWDPTDISLNGGTTPYLGRPNIPAHYLYSNSGNCSLGIDDLVEGQFHIYPNPANEWITIEGLESETSYELFTCLGQRILSGKVSAEKQISLQELASGSYYLQIGNQHLPILKQGVQH